MNDTRSLRRDLTKSVNVGHDIVPPPLLLNAGNLKAPADTTISVRALVAAMVKVADSGEEDDIMIRLANSLDTEGLSVSTQLNEALSANA